MYHKLELAAQVARLYQANSKDPSTKVGCAIFNKYTGKQISQGYNGLPSGVDIDLSDRQLKNELTLHAEKNALLHTNEQLHNCYLVVTHMPCGQCAAAIATKEIKDIVWLGDVINGDWGSSLDAARVIYEQKQINVFHYYEDSGKVSRVN